MSPDGDQEYFGDGIAEELLNALAKIPDLQVAARTSAFSFKGQNADVSTIAEALNVEAVLEGSVRKAGDELWITVQLVQADNGFHLWSETYNRPANDVFAVQDEIAQSIVDALSVQLTGEVAQAVARKGTTNTEAHNAYLLGWFQWNKRTEIGLRTAIESFQRAIDLDPLYADAHSGLADASSILHTYAFVGPEEVYPRAMAAAETSVELDDGLAAAHRSLAWMLLLSWDWEGSEREFLRALELDPDDGFAHYWYSFVLLATNRADQALAHVHQAQALDPLSLQVSVGLSDFLYYTGQIDRAIVEVNQVIEIDPSFTGAYLSLATVLNRVERYSDALQAVDRYQELSSGGGYIRVQALFGLVRDAEARRLLQDLQADSKYLDPARWAALHASLGEADDAFEWLERGFTSGSWTTTWFVFDPMFDSLRSDPRSADLIRRMGLSEYWPEYQ